MNTENQEFILIDDDMIVLKFCKMLLSKTVCGADIKIFSVPEEGLAFLHSFSIAPGKRNPVVLFLDINMPTMSGWEFLEQFDLLHDDIKNAIRIYILSSSVDDRDRERASANKYVIDYLVKPISKEAISQISHILNAVQ